MMKKFPLAAVFGSILLLIPPLSPCIAAGQHGFGGLSMAESMMKMMETMVKNRESGGAAPTTPNAWGSGQDRFGTHDDGGQGRQPMSPSFPYGLMSQPEASRLQGIWAGNGGERLQIEGTRYRLQAGPGRSADGTVSLRGGLLELYSPAFDRTWVYEFAEYEGRLVLRDADGRLYLFRRIESSGEANGPGMR